MTGKTDEAIKLLRQVAKVNNRAFSEENVVLIQQNVEKDDQQQLGNIKDLFASKAIAYRTLISWYAW